ncbi:hypothetical protein AB8O38_14955 [Saccharomonospora xinjiangensis]|uniref:hypothetical protein n=1 Tax=Saccharomonospora xinjiangensis TaxID=75294 RepID=UPI00350F1AA3
MVDLATNTGTKRVRRTRAEDTVLALFRFVVAFLFLCHGLQGFGVFGGIDGAGTAVPIGS